MREDAGEDACAPGMPALADRRIIGPTFAPLSFALSPCLPCHDYLPSPAMSVAPTASSNIARERESATVAATPSSQFLRESASSPILLHGATPRLLICAGSFFTKRGSEIAAGYDALTIRSDAASSGAGARGRESSSRSIRPGRRAIGLSALGIGRDWQGISLAAPAIRSGAGGIIPSF